MPISLIIDTETSGKADHKAPATSRLQPALLQLGAELVRGGRVMASINLLINPGPEVDIPDEVVNLHGISRAVVEKFGVTPIVAVGMFHNMAKKADRLVAHSMDFDLLIMEICYHRVSRYANFLELNRIPRVCTMLSTKNVLKLPGKYKDYKWPSLEEAYKALVDPAGFADAHSAMADVRACRKILDYLEKNKLPLVGGKR